MKSVATVKSSIHESSKLSLFIGKKFQTKHMFALLDPVTIVSSIINKTSYTAKRMTRLESTRVHWV